MKQCLHRIAVAWLWLGLGFAGPAGAEPSTNVAWTPELRAQLAEGDLLRGQQVAADCASCHGATGISPSPNWPSLAGQEPAYSYKQLRDYQDGRRVHPIMSALAETITEQDIIDVAAWYASQPLPPGERAADWDSEIALRLVRRGDGRRFIAPCAVCHGQQGEGRPIGMATLAGQTSQYFGVTLRAYKEGARANDPYGVMRRIAEQLTEEEIDALARYYAGLGTQR